MNSSNGNGENGPGSLDVERLRRELEASVSGEVRFGESDRHLYATDSSNYRQLPLGIVVPLDADDLARAVKTCYRMGAPVTLRGSGTSLAGQGTNRAVVLDHSKFLRDRIEIDPERRQAHVSPGVVLDDLQAEAAKHGLRFGPDPSTHDNCTIGGMIGNNAGGVHSVASEMAGLGARTSDNLISIDVVTGDGTRLTLGETSDAEYARIIEGGGRRAEIYHQLRSLRDEVADAVRAEYPDMPRRVSGYNLDELLPENSFHLARALAGTEGTCATILGATLALIPDPPCKALTVLGFQDIFAAAAAIPEVRESKPFALEGMDDRLMQLVRVSGVGASGVERFPEGAGWLIVEFADETTEKAAERAHRLEEKFRDRGTGTTVLTELADQEAIWAARKAGLGVTAHVAGKKDAWEGWEDTTVPPDRLGDYLRELRAMFDRYGYDGPFYGHFGQGLVHTRVTFDLKTGPGIQKYREFVREGAHLVKRFGGSLTGEHGDGQARGELLGILYSPTILEAFERFRKIWDPRGLMNPGKVVRPHRVDENLRMGEHYRPQVPTTHFAFGQDRESFAYATERCVGVGKCRSTGDGTMCPSYRATREEKHATRGRAHLLFELLSSPEQAGKGLRDEGVKEALDLCLACKACKHECPVGVDMATYKAEFFAHYYEHALRPRAAYSMGLIMFWARLATRVPRLANFFTQTGGLRRISQWVAGVTPHRAIPPFALRSFRSGFAKENNPPSDRPQVLLWPDTFNNYLLPDTAHAAVSVLEHVGWQVTLPDRPLCCGRPLYDFGMLGRARSLLLQTLEALQPALAAGMPVVVLEPSCLAVFRDEALDLLPGDEGARRLAKQAVSLAEFLERHAPDAALPQVPRAAAIHTHCHQDAVLGTDPDKSVWGRLGLDWEHLETGCCGLAGSFGFEPAKYEVSRQIGEERFAPALRARADEALLLADGFSCREQARELTGKMPLHLAELIARAFQNPATLRSGNGATRA